MLRVLVLVSGGGTNLQAILDAMEDGRITNTAIVGVISNKQDAYAITRAENNKIPTSIVSKKDYTNREDFNLALVETIDSYQPDLIVLAGLLVISPEEFIRR